MKKILLFALLFPLLQGTFGQDKPFRSISFEAGVDFINCEPPDDKDYIRADVVPYNYYYESASYVMALLYKNYYGLKFEKRILNNKLGVVSGIRYTRTDASIGKDTYWTPRTEYFYLLSAQDGTNTEFLKVKSITEISHYIGIPLEFRIYPYHEHKVQLYYKIGFDFNFLINDKADVVFLNSLMESHENEVEGIIENPWKFYATACLAIGFKIGDPGKPGINIEACVPSGILSGNRNSFVAPTIGGGIQLSIRFPF